MTLVYKCKHCGNEVGRLPSEMVDLNKIGWEHLSPEEKSQLMKLKPDQQVMIQSICENCQRLLEDNPNYHELDYFIQ
ncbi:MULTISPECIES: anti-sigma-F factor Fin [Gracilibacillus]|uniref:DUF2757 domain-containing protein n=1 Tax=Gracilibacillus dipsosauri TaxID=178340 RepID=A0A317KYL6_9BACI|nr:anti-sigma-F factor Fin [Gracilibacillus dipsosauri]PWU67830.1 DUF2757 domain-containing protein [Gracilibacillus dipsosauri]